MAHLKEHVLPYDNTYTVRSYRIVVTRSVTRSSKLNWRTIKAKIIVM